MRVVMLLLPLAFLVPLAAGQGVLPGNSATLHVDPPSGVVPRHGQVFLHARLDVPCSAADAGPEGVSVRYDVQTWPTWAIVVLQRSADRISPSDCLGGAVVLRNEASVAVNDDAPAFLPRMIGLSAQVSRALGPTETVTASVPIVAGFESVLRAEPRLVHAPIAPGGAGIAKVQITNLGNANTKVSFDVTTSDPALAVVIPSPVVVQSRQAGASETTALVLVQAFAPHASLLGPVPVTLRYTSAYALDAKLAGDSGTVQIVYDPIDGAPDQAPPTRQVPASAAPLVGVAGSLAAILLRRR